MRAYGEGPDVFVHAKQCISEWEGFMRLMKTNYSSKTMHHILKLVSTEQSLSDMFPQLTKLATICPVSTAECK